jgi:hypothetical protein
VTNAASLRFRFEPDDDGTGRLVVHAAANGFAGEGAAWFSIEELERFASQLRTYPLIEGGAAIAGGFFDNSARGVLSQEHVGITVRRLGETGQLAVQVRLATEVREHDRAEARNAVRLELLTTYNQLERFARDVVALLKGRKDEARLGGETLA